MTKYRGHFSTILFDHNHPSVGWANEHYKFVDKSDYKGLTGDNIAEAIMELKSDEALVLPEGKYYGGAPFKYKHGIIPLDTPARFRKFGPELNIVPRLTIKEIKERKITPRKALKGSLTTPEVRENLKKGTYRGIGFWSPRSRRHNIIWFDVPAEAESFLELHKSEFQTKYQFADAYQQVPSFKQQPLPRILPLQILPVTEEGQFYVEWLEEYAPPDCADAFFRGARSKKKILDEFDSVFKYINPEQIICRHGFAQRRYAEKEAEKNPDAKKILAKWFRATGYREPWKKTKTQVYIKDGPSIRRPLKTEIGTMCQFILGSHEPEYLFDLSE